MPTSMSSLQRRNAIHLIGKEHLQSLVWAAPLVPRELAGSQLTRGIISGSIERWLVRSSFLTSSDWWGVVRGPLFSYESLRRTDGSYFQQPLETIGLTTYPSSWPTDITRTDPSSNEIMSYTHPTPSFQRLRDTLMSLSCIDCETIYSSTCRTCLTRAGMVRSALSITTKNSLLKWRCVDGMSSRNAL